MREEPLEELGPIDTTAPVGQAAAEWRTARSRTSPIGHGSLALMALGSDETGPHLGNPDQERFTAS